MYINVNLIKFEALIILKYLFSYMNKHDDHMKKVI